MKSKSFDKEEKQLLMGPGAINQFVNTLLCGRSIYRFCLYDGLGRGLNTSEVCSLQKKSVSAANEERWAGSGEQA